MTPPEEHHRYWEQIGAFLLGKLDGGERTAMQTHLNSCPVCQAEVRELEPVVEALADAAPDRIDKDPWPPWDLEELTLAPILGEIHRARRRRRRFRWSALAAAAICVVVIGLAGFVGLLEPEVPLEPLSFSVVAPSVEAEGILIAHAGGTEIRLVVSGLRDGQTHRVTLVSEDGERVNAGTFIGIGAKPLKCTFNAALLRKDAAIRLPLISTRNQRPPVLGTGHATRRARPGATARGHPPAARSLGQRQANPVGVTMSNPLMINHHLTSNRRGMTSTKLNREQPIYGCSLLWDPASGDLRSVPSRSLSHVTVLGCTRAWQNGRSPADLPISTKCRAAAPAPPGRSSD